MLCLWARCRADPEGGDKNVSRSLVLALSSLVEMLGPSGYGLMCAAAGEGLASGTAGGRELIKAKLEEIDLRHADTDIKSIARKLVSRL